MQYYLAIDIGASSGRHILGHKEGERMVLEEIYRFPNGMQEKDGRLVWDVQQLFEEIKTGMKTCKALGKIPYSVGIDTWAVDFVLLNEKGEILGDAVAYRDARTKGMDELVYESLSEEALYARTGIQKQPFNTIYQLMALKEKAPELLKKADKLLMIPDYFHYLLTGVAVTEYTNATTTQLVDPETKIWDEDLLSALSYPREMFQEIRMPGTCLGKLTPALQEELGYNCNVVLPATHDTGSAVMAVPARQENMVYISSGTWSLMGTEILQADCTPESRQQNFTNEGGYGYRFRYLKNIMGLWMIQSVRKEWDPDISYGVLCEAAGKCKISSVVDCNDDRFLAPESMTGEVQKACRETGQPVPEGLTETAAVIYNSLADCYACTLQELEARRGEHYDRIHIIGGGANADYLNQLTANATKRKVYAGPVEATAIGNLMAQMIAAGCLKTLQEGRECVFRSFPVNIYTPQ